MMNQAIGLLARHGSMIGEGRPGGRGGAAKRRALGLVGAAMMTAAMGSMAHGETLADAISLAYQTNPTLKQAREQQKALDEQFVQASQNLRPQVSFDGVFRSTDTRGVFLDGDPGAHTNVTSGTLGLSATQILSTFGRTAAQVSVAEATVLAGRENLRQQESNIILSVIEAYAAVRRDEANVGFATQAVAAFQGQVDQARERLKAGDSTKTDIGQAESQLASTQAALVAAKAALQQSRAAYARLVGQNPGTLAPLPPLPNMPKAVEAAYAAAEENSPTILQAVMSEKAARANVQEARSEFRPTASLTGEYALSGTNPFHGSGGAFGNSPFVNQSSVIGLSVSMPLLTGGLLRSRVREAQANDRASVSAIEVARREVVETVSTGWNQIVASEQQTTLGNAAVEAAKISSEGAKLEYGEGFRAFFEVLNEEQRLLDAQQLVNQAEYNRVVGQAAVLNAIGELDVDKLISGESQYDPKANFDKVRHKGGTPLDPVFTAIDRATGPALPQVPNQGGAAPAVGSATMVPATDTPVSGAGFSTSVPTNPNEGDVLGGLIEKSQRADRPR